MELNERIKRLRISKSLTQKELGELVCVSETSIKCWESGAKKPSLQKIILLCKAFGVSTDCLLGVSINYSTENSMYNLLLTTSEKVMLNNYRSLDKHGKCVVETVCELEKKRIIDSAHSDDNVPLIKKKNQTKIIPKYLTPIAAGYSVPIDEDRFRSAVANWVQEEKLKFRQEEKTTNRMLIGFLVIASLFIILSLQLEKRVEALSYTIIPVLGSVALGRAAGICLTDLPINRAKRQMINDMENNSPIIFELQEPEK